MKKLPKSLIVIRLCQEFLEIGQIPAQTGLEYVVPLVVLILRFHRNYTMCNYRSLVALHNVACLTIFCVF